MDDTRISQLTFGEPLSGTEYVPIVQYTPTISALQTVYTNPGALADYIIGEAIDALYPVGAVIPYAGSLSAKDIPSGWLLCDGRSVSADEYPRLYACISSMYGSAISGTFTLPNLKGRTIVGHESIERTLNFNTVEASWPKTRDVAVGTTGGEFFHKVNTSELPVRSSSISIPVIESTAFSDIHQELSWSLSVDGGNYFTLQNNLLVVDHEGRGATAYSTTISYKTYVPATGAIINQGSFTTSGGEGSFTLPFTILPTSDAIITLTGRYNKTIISRPTNANGYKTVIWYDDHRPRGRDTYGGYMKLVQSLPRPTYDSSTVYTPSNAGAYTNIMQPYMALNYIIKY